MSLKPIRPRDYCRIPACTDLMILVNGVLVCPNCDAVDEWPSVKRGEAEIDRG